MAEFGEFRYGNVGFPLSTGLSNPLLRDADPALFYTLEFFTSVITTHVGPRLLAEAAAVGATQITAAVAESLPLNPEPYLTENHLRFPLLGLYRKGTTFRYVNRRRAGLHVMEVAYVLPPVKPSEAERVLPILHAVGLILDNRTTQGFDPAYTPSMPTGTPGEFVWSGDRAGVRKVEIKSSTTGAYSPTPDLYFPALIMTLELDEMGDATATAFKPFDGADVTIDERDADGTEVEDLVEFATHGPPTLTSISPATGSSSGGTPVTLTGTGFLVGTRPVVLFDGAAADSVSVVSPTTITCLSPPHNAFPTFVADVTLIAADKQSATLESAFTYTA